MDMLNVTLIDSSRKVLATARVAEEGDRYGGTIDLCCTPASVRALFAEFEEIVNGQMLSFLDEIQDKIGALSVRAVFPSGREAAVKDLQVYPSTGEVSFRLAEVLVPSTKLP
jgi:hypothetical protein